MMRCVHALIGVLLLAAAAIGQVDPPKPVSKDVARAAAKEFASEFKSKDVKMRMAAIDRLTPYKHALVAQCLAKALKDSSPEVRAAAAIRLGGQDRKISLKTLGKALADKRNRKTHRVTVAIFEAYRAQHAAPGIKMLRKLFMSGSKEVQREVIRTTRYCRTKDSIKFLADLVDMPQPGNVDSASNPPASYWKDRVTRWNFWFMDVTESLVHLTGREFDSSKAASDWLRSSAKILSLEAGQKAVDDL